MARGDTEQLVVSLEARIAQFERNFERANRTANRQWSSIERRSQQASRRLETTFAATGRNLALIFGPLTFAGLIAGAGRAISTLSELGKQAKRTGVDVESLQALAFGAQLWSSPRSAG